MENFVDRIIVFVDILVIDFFSCYIVFEEFFVVFFVDDCVESSFIFGGFEYFLVCIEMMM